MGKNHWTDLDVDGRRLERCIKTADTLMEKYIKEGDNDLALAWFDRLIKASNQKLAITNTNNKLNMLFKLAEKKHADEIINIGLKELSDKKK